MKPPISTLLTALALLALLGAPAFADSPGLGLPYQPVGTLDVSKKHVRTGMKPNLSWNITYPTTAADLVTIDHNGGLTTNDALRVKIRVAGVAFQSGSKELPVAFSLRVGSGSWQRLFLGTGSQVQPDHYVFEQVVSAGTKLDFAGQGRKADGSWYGARWTAEADVAVVGLVDGQEVPDYAPAYDQGDIVSFLSAYIEQPGTGTAAARPVANLGPRDMIYLFELASRNPGDWWFDMQDLAVMISFEPISE